MKRSCRSKVVYSQNDEELGLLKLMGLLFYFKVEKEPVPKSSFEGCVFLCFPQNEEQLSCQGCSVFYFISRLNRTCPKIGKNILLTFTSKMYRVNKYYTVPL